METIFHDLGTIRNGLVFIDSCFKEKYRVTWKNMMVLADLYWKFNALMMEFSCIIAQRKTNLDFETLDVPLFYDNFKFALLVYA